MTGREFAGSPQRMRLALSLLCGTVLAGISMPVLAQDAPAPAGAAPAAETPAPQSDVIRTIAVAGAQRLEPQTIVSYIRMRPGDVFTQASADQALKDLYATELFASANIVNNGGDVLITVVENPVINRVVLEGNKRIKEDKITKEIKLAPRQIFTRSKVRADVARIIELYKRQGRFAASVEPKMVELSQNRVDVVFEINEGPKSKVRAINIVGNEAFSDGELRSEMITKESRATRLLSSRTTYDPDRLAFDQQKLRQFYLTQGYADFRVVSAVAELTPDKRDFIITYVVEEGKRYKFGDVAVKSEIRDFSSEGLTKNLPMKTGDWYNAKQVEDTVEQFTDLAGTFGYAFADVAPDFKRNKDTLTMDVTYVLKEAPRVYVERVDVNGNTLTQDKVVRREFRLVEGDAFNTLQVKRSENRIKSLGFFQESFEIAQKEGTTPDRIALEANVEEQATGQLQLSAGFSSIESFILAASVQQRNFRGRGQTVGAGVNYSRYSKSANLSFSEPYVFDRNISAGIDLYRRDTNSFNYLNTSRNTTFQQTTTGGQVRLGLPLTEYLSAVGSYTLNFDDVSLDQTQFFSDRVTPGTFACDPLLAGRYLCEAVGKRTSSILGLTVGYDTLDSRLRPTRGRSAAITAEYAGLGGSVNFARLRGNAAQYYPLGKGFVFSLRAEGGIIKGLGGKPVQLTDRFFLGEPQIRGFDIRGVGPRVIRRPTEDPDANGVYTVTTDPKQRTDDALGGTYYYVGRAELEIPLGSGVKELGLRPSIFMDVGALWGIRSPALNNCAQGCIPLYTQSITNADGTVSTITTSSAINSTTGAANVPTGTYQQYFVEQFLGDSPSPRLSVGVGVNWNSPFGPLRIDFSQVLLKQPGDDTKRFTFNVGTQF
jgi:outer membrane protein insertion porin family